MSPTQGLAHSATEPDQPKTEAQLQGVAGFLDAVQSMVEQNETETTQELSELRNTVLSEIGDKYAQITNIEQMTTAREQMAALEDLKTGIFRTEFANSLETLLDDDLAVDRFAVRLELMKQASGSANMAEMTPEQALGLIPNETISHRDSARGELLEYYNADEGKNWEHEMAQVDEGVMTDVLLTITGDTSNGFDMVDEGTYGELVRDPNIVNTLVKAGAGALIGMTANAVSQTVGGTDVYDVATGETIAGGEKTGSIVTHGPDGTTVDMGQVEAKVRGIKEKIQAFAGDNWGLLGIGLVSSLWGKISGSKLFKWLIPAGALGLYLAKQMNGGWGNAAKMGLKKVLPPGLFEAGEQAADHLATIGGHTKDAVETVTKVAKKLSDEGVETKSLLQLGSPLGVLMNPSNAIETLTTIYSLMFNKSTPETQTNTTP